jgi:hypothetical protein
MALQQKDIESSYAELDEYRQEQKKYRVKVKQLENDLEHNLKRLDIICKSKGLPRPKRPDVAGPPPGRITSYASPYGQRGNSGTRNTSGNRNLSNSQTRKPLGRGPSYTPPNKRTMPAKQSPMGSLQRSPAGSVKGQMNQTRNSGKFSAGNRSNHS